MKEKDLYEPIRLWLENDTVNAMGGKRPKTFGFFDVHSQYLNRYLIQKNLTQCLGAESFGWRIKVDLFGYVQKENSEVKKYIVEVKDKQANGIGRIAVLDNQNNQAVLVYGLWKDGLMTDSFAPFKN